MLRQFLERHLDPVDSLGEALFGLIMALTVSLGASLLLSGSEVNPREIAVAMIGCNIAWGVIDGVLYLLGSVFSRNSRALFVRRLKAARDDAEAQKILQDEFGLEDEPIASDADRTAARRAILDVMRRADPRRTGLRAADLKAAVVIAVLVSAIAWPGVLPFLFIDDRLYALRVSNLVQIALLFGVGSYWARYTGAPPWRTGAFIVALGVALVLVAVALGG